MTELLMNNIFFVYLLGSLAIINYVAFEKKQKIAIIYACSFGLTFNRDLRCVIILGLLLFILFLYEEYLGKDLVKIKYVKRIRYKFFDFMYMYVFQFDIIYIISAIILRSNICRTFLVELSERNVILVKNIETVLLIISILLLFIGIYQMFNNSVELKDFQQINQKFSEYPYYLLPLSDEKKRDTLFKKLELVADIEDYTFFTRKNSYCSFSLEFIKAVMCKKKLKKNIEKKGVSGWIYKIWWRAIYFFTVENFLVFVKNKHEMRTLKKFIRRIYKKISIEIIQKLEQSKKIIKRCFRGYSTIEMQLIRILAYKKGLKMGKPQNLRDAYLIFTRKIYEIIYAPMFFSGLKEYLMISKKSDFYRYYLVYIYLHTVQTTLNGRTFAPLDKVFRDVDVIDWPKEALFVIVLGLNNLKITQERVDVYVDIIIKYQLNKELIYQLIACI